MFKVLSPFDDDIFYFKYSNLTGCSNVSVFLLKKKFILSQADTD